MEQGQEEFHIGEVVVDQLIAEDEVKETETMEFEEPPLDEEKELEPPRLYIHKSCIGAAQGDQKFQMVMKYVQN